MASGSAHPSQADATSKRERQRFVSLLVFRSFSAPNGMAKYRLTRGFLLCCTLLALTLYLVLSPRSAASNSRSSTSASRAQSGKVTVLLSAYRTTGLRPQWIRDTAALYTSSPFHHIVDRVILVWNEPTAPPPRMPKRVQVIKGKVNSMNNRYVQNLPLLYALGSSRPSVAQMDSLASLHTHRRRPRTRR